jgi:hypothetical protein
MMTFCETTEQPPMADDTRERLAALEVEVRNLTKHVASMAETLDTLNVILNQAKGARWAVLGVAALAGFFSGKLGGLFAAIGYK